VEECRVNVPDTFDLGDGHLAACIKADSEERAFS
jgi:hypothetical protein